MVDVGEKPVTRRTASATAVCVMNLLTAEAIRANSLSKGDVLQVARLAGIGAAKRTDSLSTQDGQDDAPTEVFADGRYEPVGADLSDIEIAGYGYRWIRLARTIGARVGSAR